MNEWELLRHSQPAEALQVMQAAYDAKDRRSPSIAIELGALYLWLNEWQAAWKHFRDFTEVYPSTMDFAFVYAGIARWCAGDSSAAVAEWRQGIDVEYADTAGGISIPLHLFFAAASRPDSVPEAEAIELLRNRLSGRRGHSWPGHLGRLVLGEMSYEEVLVHGMKSISHFRDEQLSQAQACIRHEVTFWEGVRLLSRNDRAGFLTAMYSVGNLPLNALDEGIDYFIDRFRSSELHLARYEARQG